MGLFSPEAAGGYMSAKRIAKELGFSYKNVNKIISEIGLSPIKARFGTRITDAYSPEDIARIRESAESMGLFSPEAPEGYMSVNRIAEELGISYKTVNKIISEIDLSPIKARFGTQITDAYSPEDIVRIREQLRINRENKP
jgi:biotin operon repressor